MAKVKAPILSMDARGQIGKSQVYASWRGIQYARQHVIPANPNTAAQQLTRNTLDSLMEQYKRTSTLGRAPWDSATVGRPLTARNQVVKTNLPGLRSAANMQTYQGSPGSLAGLPATAILVANTAVAGELNVTITPPSVPTGWTLVSVIAIAFTDRAPTTKPTDFPQEGEQTTVSPGVGAIVAFTGLTAATLYVASGWVKWARPDGRTAYGASLTGFDTTT